MVEQKIDTLPQEVIETVFNFLIPEAVIPELIKNCAWCHPPDQEGGRDGRPLLRSNQQWTDGICNMHIAQEMLKSKKEVKICL